MNSGSTPSDDGHLPIVKLVDGVPMADSRDVAATFKRNHRDVLRAHRDAHCSPEFRQRNFAPFKIKDLAGESTSYVLMTKNGFAFLALGFTGAEAGAFKEAYIERFDAMEQELRRQAEVSNVHFLVPRTLPEALRLAADQAEQIERQNAQITAMAPKVAFHDKVTEAINCQTVAEVAKILGTGQNRLFAWLRGAGLLMRSNLPYQRFVDEGYFRVVEGAYKDARNEARTYTRTLVTGKGFAYIQRRFGAAA